MVVTALSFESRKPQERVCGGLYFEKSVTNI